MMTSDEKHDGDGDVDKSLSRVHVGGPTRGWAGQKCSSCDSVANQDKTRHQMEVVTHTAHGRITPHEQTLDVWELKRDFKLGRQMHRVEEHLVVVTVSHPRV